MSSRGQVSSRCTDDKVTIPDQSSILLIQVITAVTAQRTAQGTCWHTTTASLNQTFHNRGSQPASQQPGKQTALITVHNLI
jgi:hypothetical protein